MISYPVAWEEAVTVEELPTVNASVEHSEVFLPDIGGACVSIQ